jgi:hypothetical protein
VKPESAAIDNFAESKITTLGSGSIVSEANGSPRLELAKAVTGRSGNPVPHSKKAPKLKVINHVFSINTKNAR